MMIDENMLNQLAMQYDPAPALMDLSSQLNADPQGNWPGMPLNSTPGTGQPWTNMIQPQAAAGAQATPGAAPLNPQMMQMLMGGMTPKQSAPPPAVAPRVGKLNMQPPNPLVTAQGPTPVPSLANILGVR